MNYFLLVFNGIVWLTFTIIFIIQDKTFNYAIAAVIFNIYLAATIVVAAIKEQ